MQHLHEMRRLLFVSVVMISSLFFSTQSMASEIKVYLNEVHAEQIIGISEVKTIGYTINFIYLDRLSELQDQISERVTGEYQESIDLIIAEKGLESLIDMNDIERTEFFMSRFSEMNEKPISPKSVLPSELSDVRHAITDIIEAEEQGITEEQLPVILFEGKLFEQSYDLLRVLKND